MASTTAAPHPLGRPRDPRIDTAVLVAVVELLEETGYQGLTIAAVAARAGTTKPAVYRRWPSKAQLVYEAVFPIEDQDLVPDGDDLVADLHRMATAALELFGRPAVRAAVPGLLADLSGRPGLHAELQLRFADPVWGRMHARIERAVASGQARPDADPDVLIDVLGGTAMMALAIRPGRAPDDLWIDRVVDLLTKGLLA
jgi:AcrR family transcriptional regulator